MRCFIAIDLDKQTRNALGDLQKQLAAKVDVKKGDVKWVEPENIHLTLKFMGELDEAKLPEISGIAEQVAAAHNKFTLDIETVGSFGGRSAKVVWVGAGKGAEELIALQKDLDDQLETAGYLKEDREFSAHLTLCRVRNPKAGVKLADACQAFGDYKVGSISADALCVYQSQLTPAGPNYTLLGDFKLR